MKKIVITVRNIRTIFRFFLVRTHKARLLEHSFMLSSNFRAVSIYMITITIRGSTVKTIIQQPTYIVNSSSDSNLNVPHTKCIRRCESVYFITVPIEIVHTKTIPAVIISFPGLALNGYATILKQMINHHEQI